VPAGLATAFELLYRFPVAYKFRQGYGSERPMSTQWMGAPHLPDGKERTPASISRSMSGSAPWSATLRRSPRHIVLSLAPHLGAQDGNDVSVWQLANQLPIGVLV